MNALEHPDISEAQRTGYPYRPQVVEILVTQELKMKFISENSFDYMNWTFLAHPELMDQYIDECGGVQKMIEEMFGPCVKARLSW